MWRGSGWRLGRCLLSGPRILSGPQSGCGWTGTLGFTCHRPAPANHIRPFPQHRGLIRAPSSLRLGPLVGPGTSRLERRAERGRTVVRANSAARDPPRSIARQTSRRRGPRGVRPRPGRREVRDGTKGGAPRGKKPRASGKLVETTTVIEVPIEAPAESEAPPAPAVEEVVETEAAAAPVEETKEEEASPAAVEAESPAEEVTPEPEEKSAGEPAATEAEPAAAEPTEAAQPEAAAPAAEETAEPAVEDPKTVEEPPAAVEEEEEVKPEVEETAAAE
ncbi:hypothetical protein BHM03_00048335 [Ensete ventricosum]|uniref:Uncharacterized protein n=1 Tax=Ensete ventricosum TaxID=4639 RepID=A0A445ML81_ENSVE|nr:hypothetical protein BHM03_00048335 [Ensete ventricosum]